MQIDLNEILRPSFQIKLFLSVFWIIFMVLMNGINLPFIADVVVVVSTCLLVIGWFRYPYPFNTIKSTGDNDTNEESDNKEETIKYT